jgi:Rrf2 family iron-sulfur cluster assembly transcriptional regulator
MLHSPTCQHALRALIYLASKSPDKPVLVNEIADAAKVPRHSLAKILHGLRNKGLVKSTKGPGGGYKLARPGSETTIVEVVEAVDGPLRLAKSCVLGLEECNGDEPCALHDYWKMFRGQYYSTISALTLEAAAASLDPKQK